MSSYNDVMEKSSHEIAVIHNDEMLKRDVPCVHGEVGSSNDGQDVLHDDVVVMNDDEILVYAVLQYDVKMDHNEVETATDAGMSGVLVEDEIIDDDEVTL